MLRVLWVRDRARAAVGSARVVVMEMLLLEVEQARGERQGDVDC
jgi:hypothetical protein